VTSFILTSRTNINHQNSLDLLKCLCAQVWLSRMDGHMGLGNSVALKLAGISSLLEDPEGGTIIRTAGGGNIK
jgi:predicted amidohydrolase YtcJ